MLYAGSLVFAPPAHPVDLRDWSQWWTLRKGADRRHPYGPKSSIGGLDNHPVVHVAFRDALAYARWAGKHLPNRYSDHRSLRTRSNSRRIDDEFKWRWARPPWATPLHEISDSESDIAIKPHALRLIFHNRAYCRHFE